MELDTLLARAVELGASDIHLKLGRPPMLRRDGALGPMEDAPNLTEDHLDGYLQRVTKVKPERYASPGTERNVSADVSVATIDAITAPHGIACPPRK